MCSQPWTAIINNGILNVSFDGGLNLADLIPMQEMNYAPIKKNHRNVSLLPVVSKIFEKHMQSQISGYVETYLRPFLYGYRKGYNPQHAQKSRISLDKGRHGGGIIMDLSKAFDTLNHDLLILMDLIKNPLSLIKSYLSDRWQRTKINTSYNTWSELIVGVPQGSVLGPLLFNLFINYLFFNIKTDICNYGDDNTPYAVDITLGLIAHENGFAMMEGNLIPASAIF